MVMAIFTMIETASPPVSDALTVTRITGVTGVTGVRAGTMIMETGGLVLLPVSDTLTFSDNLSQRAVTLITLRYR